MKKTIITFIFLITFTIPYFAIAQDLQKKWELGVAGGYYFGTAKEDGSLRIRDERIQSYERTLGLYKVTLNNDPIVYFNIGYRFKDYGLFRIQAGYAKYEFKIVRDYYKIPDEVIEDNYEILPLKFNLNYFLMRKSSFKPYITLGANTNIFLSSDQFKVSPTTRIGVSLGTGFEYFFTEVAALTFDMGYNFLKIELQATEPFTKRGYDQTFDEINAIPDTFEVSLGFKFLIF
jgi:hypothetical protein